MKIAAKKIISLLLVIAVVFSLGTAALAKTSSDKIDAPAGSEEVFYVKLGNKNVSYTWDEIAGKGSFATQTNDYGAKINDELTTQEWTGVMLADILDDVQSKTGIELEDDYKIKAVAADDYVVSFTVADVKDADNRYMVACDPVSNYDGETKFDNSYVRILRGDEQTTANNANIRCLLGIEILDASGNAIATGGKTQGGDVENSVFYIAVQESAESEIKYYYYTMDELKAYDDIHDFVYVDHSVAKTVKGRGASVANLLADIADAEITDDMIVQYAETDGYHADTATPIEDSAYKDKVAWLSESHVTAGGDTADAVETVICYQSWTIYDNPDENNVNSTEWEDADMGSGYLRAYRQRDDANSAVIKTVMGIVVSYNGQVFSGKDGYTLKAVSDKGYEMEIIEPSTGKTYTSQQITGLVPGMQYAVKAPEINNASVKSGDKPYQVITAKSGVDEVATFTYTEDNYITVKTADGTQNYTYTELKNSSAAVQTPSKEEVEEHGTPYGYYDSMYYRYNGVWLNDLTGGKTNIVVTDTAGKTVTIAAADTAKYFVAYGYTASKSSTNVSEGKRYSYAYSDAKLIIPGEGTLVGEAEVGAEGNKMVTVAVESVASVASEGLGSAYFTDMNGYGWAASAADSLYEAGIVKGTGSSKYSPASNIKRGDFILMLYRAYDLKAEADGNFADVEKGSYWYDAIAAAKALGIAKGYGENFKPEETITRQDAMVLLFRTLVLKGIELGEKDDLKAFPDASDLSSYAKDAVSALVGAGVINGKNGSLVPKANMTRAEMAVALYKAITNLG